MAMTGFQRTGQCVVHNVDKGSHHICIDLSSTGVNFCVATGQTDPLTKESWCDEPSACGDGGLCPIKDWCVCQFSGRVNQTTRCLQGAVSLCAAVRSPDRRVVGCRTGQWAFSGYVKAEGCSAIQSIDCEATNLEALKAYRAQSKLSGADVKYKIALDCIKTRCTNSSLAPT